MSEVVDVNGDRKLKYSPENATQSHAVQALTGSANQSNGAFTFRNKAKDNVQWYSLEYADTDTAIIFFDYEVFANGKTPNYQFRWQDASGNWHAETLSGSGSIYREIPASNLKRIQINCPASAKSEVEGTYMYIDNLGVGKIEGQQAS